MTGTRVRCHIETTQIQKGEFTPTSEESCVLVISIHPFSRKGRLI
jgi:hypothetical protein